MSTRATSSFVIDTWQEDAYDDRPGAKLTRTRLTKTFTGDLEGTGVVDALMAYAQDGGAGYVAMERITGTLHGRKGSFVLQHSALSSPSGQSATWSIVPSSGTDELRGLGGEARIERHADGSHTFTLEYELR